jgi:hypothetical protein
MSSQTLVRRRGGSAAPGQRTARSRVLAVSSSLPGADVFLVLAAASLAVCVFELAAWLASAPLTTLIYSVAFVPLALLVTAVVFVSERRP